MTRNGPNMKSNKLNGVRIYLCILKGFHYSNVDAPL